MPDAVLLAIMRPSNWYWTLILACLPPLALPAAAVDERVSAYLEFRTQFDAGNYGAALPLAARVVELTRSTYGAEAPELANPLSNLATTYHRMKENGTALDTYREALTLLDLAGNATDPRLIPVLQGMGAALRGLQRDPDAIAPLRRAVEILRNRNGLFSPTQLPVLKELVGCYTTVGQLEEAGREQQYAYTVAETAYGKNDPRLLGPLEDYARWSETAGRYTAARALHARAVQIADATHGSNTLLAVNGLRGIARSYRLAFLNGETEETAATANAVPTSVANSALPRILAAPSSEGERALRIALQRLTTAATPVPLLHGEVLLDLGDWQLTAGADSRALALYGDAWKVLAPANGAGALTTPVVIVYRAPAAAVSRGLEDPEKFDEQDVALRLSVAADGKVRDVSVVNPVPERESAEKAVMGAVRRATWRPAFRDGAPVISTDVMFSERVYVRRPPAPKEAAPAGT
jgi:tetratricopeptide (TPR) repeat protein